MRWLMIAAVVLLACPGQAEPAVPAVDGGLGVTSAAAEAAKGWVCPMPEHTQVFDKPGTCPICGMKLVPRGTLVHRRVAVLVFDGVEVIDYAAPYEVLGQAGYQVFTVGQTTATVTAAMGQKLVPSYSFADAPPAGIVVLPGGDLPADDAGIVGWVRARSQDADVVLSVCNGAFWLARAGALDGLTVTTFHQLIDALQQAAPKAYVVRDRRFVDNGRIVTAAGLTSGMDGALHVVDKLLGRDKAREVALQLEYDWHPDSSYARAALADRYLPNIDLGPAVRFERSVSLGGLDHWRVEGTVRAAESRQVLLDRIAAQLTQRAHWKQSDDRDADQVWTFSDGEGRAWRALVDLAPATDATPGEGSHAYHATFRLERLAAPRS